MIMSNSVFHQIYKEKIEDAINTNAVEDYRAMGSIYAMYLSTVISTFKWKNLPKKTLPFNIETYLCYWGMCAMFKDDDGELRIFPCYPAGALKENGEYEEYIMVAMNGKNWRRKRDDIALCYDNCLRVPSLFMIKEFATKSTNALRAVDHALERSMLPAIIECESEEEMRRLSDYYDRKKNGLPFRLTYKEGNNAQGSKVNDVFDSRRYDVVEFWDVYVRYRNLFYTSFGINNVEIQKRERLTEAEGSGNDEITRYTLLQDKVDRREDFVDEVKEKFDYDLEFEVNRDSATVYNISLDNEDKIEDVELNILKGINTKAANPEDVNEEAEMEENDNGKDDLDT